jgi:hypothetical protein
VSRTSTSTPSTSKIKISGESFAGMVYAKNIMRTHSSRIRIAAKENTPAQKKRPRRTLLVAPGAAFTGGRGDRPQYFCQLNALSM